MIAIVKWRRSIPGSPGESANVSWGRWLNVDSQEWVDRRKKRTEQSLQAVEEHTGKQEGEQIRHNSWIVQGIRAQQSSSHMQGISINSCLKA